MAEADDSRSWLATVPGVLTALGAAATAFAGLITALAEFFPKSSGDRPAAVHQDCAPGYVWRKANGEDHICVTLEAHLKALQDNEIAASRRDPNGGPFGPDTCKNGFVFRDAFPGDHICVEVATRAQAFEDNRQAAVHMQR